MFVLNKYVVENSEIFVSVARNICLTHNNSIFRYSVFCFFTMYYLQIGCICVADKSYVQQNKWT
jgi:hypothetical protein